MNKAPGVMALACGCSPTPALTTERTQSAPVALVLRNEAPNLYLCLWDLGASELTRLKCNAAPFHVENKPSIIPTVP